MPASPIPDTSQRDLRLDFFRGLALWFIFVDHVPSTALADVTFRNFGFSDATEIFVFISGYTAVLVYGRVLARRGFAYAAAQVLRRCWQLYVAHLVLFLIYVAQIAWVADRFGASAFVEEMNIARFFESPQEAVIEALLLHYRPVNLDVLPLYIALLASLPLWLAALLRAPFAVLAASVALWGGVQAFDWTAPVYANGDTWLFNPLGWQLLFVLGALCSLDHARLAGLRRWRPVLGALAVAWLAFSAMVAVSWKVPALEQVVTPWVEAWLYPIDKTNLDLARVLHFGAIAYLVAHWVRRDAASLRSAWARPVIWCGQHSLQVFCLGISLSFVAHAVLVGLGRSVLNEGVVIVGGLALMSACAWVMDWYRQRGAARPAAAPGS